MIIMLNEKIIITMLTEKNNDNNNNTNSKNNKDNKTAYRKDNDDDNLWHTDNNAVAYSARNLPETLPVRFWVPSTVIVVSCITEEL